MYKHLQTILRCYTAPEYRNLTVYKIKVLDSEPVYALAEHKADLAQQVFDLDSPACKITPLGYLQDVREDYATREQLFTAIPVR